MDDCESLLSKDGGGFGGEGSGAGAGMNGKSADLFIDRSKVRILLCDNDLKSSEEVFGLLCKCSYHVTSVRSARQVIDALNAEGHDIDIILLEVDLPLKKGLKLLKYIMRDKELQRIPVIMMSAQDEVSTVVKCLSLGAADYLVKPLRTNELLNLWTHMWRRRRMLGIADKDIINYDFDVAVSDPSDANTNSTTLFSDDTDDRSRKTINPDMSVPIHQEVEVSLQFSQANNFNAEPMLITDPTGHHPRQISSCPKKSELKIGESSAFFTYVKSSILKNKNSSQVAASADRSVLNNKSSSQGVASSAQNVALPTKIAQDTANIQIEELDIDPVRHENREACENNSPGDEFPSSTSFPDSTSMERSSTPPASMEFLRSKSTDEGSCQMHMYPRNRNHHFDPANFTAHAAYPYYMPGMMNQAMMPNGGNHQLYQQNMQDMHKHNTSTMAPQYNHLPHCASNVPGMASFPYYPVGLCVQPGQVPNSGAQHHQWPSFPNSSAPETKATKVDRREAALIKFRQKRKERCFDKKIRYVNRKKLAERRPRVRGQFVRKMNGVNVDLNGTPSAELDDEDEDDDDNVSRDSSPEDEG
ncbi:hypothetical protein V2J09_014940 [Rumex salicifolius]